jgi:hypothetical protein
MYYEFIMTFIFDLLLIIKVVIKNILNIREILKTQYTLVTASDEKHYQYLLNFIENFQSTKINHFKKLIIYDLGLSKSQLHQLKDNSFIEIRKFSFENYPKFYGKRLSEHKNKIGGFAWKPEIINLLRNEKINHIIWFDSATSFKNNILLFKIFIHEYGFFSFHSTGTIKQWTHFSVLAELKVEDNDKLLNSSNLMAGVIGFDFNKQFARKLHSNWNELSSREDLIFPKNSSSSNHRHDQSLLSIVYWKSSQQKLPKNTDFFGIKIQNWPNKILFFFDERDGLRQKLLIDHSFNATTTDSRCKVMILLNPGSLSKIPLRLTLTKKIILFIFDEIDQKNLSRYLLKKRLITIHLINNKYRSQNNDKTFNDLEFSEVNNIIKEEYRIMAHEK